MANLSSFNVILKSVNIYYFLEEMGGGGEIGTG
jgi:hypothetical protein